MLRVTQQRRREIVCKSACVCACVHVWCVCVCWVGSCPAIKLGWFHQLSAHLSPGLQTLTRHFSYNLGTRTSPSLTHTSKHTQTDLC